MLNSSVSKNLASVNGEINDDSPRWLGALSQLQKESLDDDIELGALLSAVSSEGFDEGYLKGTSEVWFRLFEFWVEGVKQLEPRLSRHKFYSLCAEVCLKRAQEAQE